MRRAVKLLILLVLSFSLFAAAPMTAQALTEEEVREAVESQGEEAVAGNVFIWFLCAVAFLKVSQKIDSFMSSLGINVGHTGGSMLSEAMLAAKVISGGMKGGGKRFGGSGAGGDTGGMTGGIIGSSSRQIGRSAAKSATSEGKSGGIGGRIFQSSLSKKGEFANQVIGSVAKGSIGENGTITGDTAVRAMESYFGAGTDPASPAMQPSETAIPMGGAEDGDPGTAGTVVPMENCLPDSPGVPSGQDGAAGVQEPGVGNGIPSEYAGNNPIPAGSAMPDPGRAGVSPVSGQCGTAGGTSGSGTVGRERDAGQSQSGSRIPLSPPGADQVRDTGHTGGRNDSINTAEPVQSNPIPYESGGGDAQEMNTGSGETFIPLSPDIAGQGASISNESGSSSSGETSDGAVESGQMHSETSMTASYSNVEIGGGRVTATEVNSQNPKGISMAMYHAGQYMPPEGPYQTVKAADGSKWYKQYAQPTAVRSNPHMETDTKSKKARVVYDERIEKKLPPPPRRKDRI